MLTKNRLLEVDTYKLQHNKMYPPTAEHIFAYMESREDARFDYTVVLGTAYMIKELLSKPIMREEVEEAYEISKSHGVPINYEGWMSIVNDRNGVLPLEIRAVKEGTIVPKGNVILTVVNTDSKYPWLTNFFEPSILRYIWYPSTVCTVSHYIKHEKLDYYLQKTTDKKDQDIDFMLHDFGARGVSSLESAAIGGAAHLVNFKGTDNLASIPFIKELYEDSTDYMPAFSIPATEHSNMTTWGGIEGEKDAFENVIKKYTLNGKAVSIVSDSYNILNAIDNIMGKDLKGLIENSKGRIVVRPDSGNPNEIVPLVLEKLGNNFGYSVNSKGYKMLPNNLRVIQGDGISYLSIENILEHMTERGWATGNIVFGSGGGLLQYPTRDWNSFAYKVSSIKKNNNWEDVQKNPVTSLNKKSKAGLLILEELDGKLRTRKVNSLVNPENELEIIYKDGKFKNSGKFEEIRERANKRFSS